MDPAMKRFYIQVLLVVGIAILGVNVIHQSPAPLACRNEMPA